MVLGGLSEGVTPLEMARPTRRSPTRASAVGIARPRRRPGRFERVKGATSTTRTRSSASACSRSTWPRRRRAPVAVVISSGTGKAAQIGEFAAGKTGTTENYGDAWFVGFNDDLTVAVWVGYPERAKPMQTEYHGSPVAGGTFPAEIWHDLMTAWIGIRDQRVLDRGGNPDAEDTSTTPTLPSGPATTAPAPAGRAPRRTRAGRATRSPATRGPRPRSPPLRRSRPPPPRRPALRPSPRPPRPPRAPAARATTAAPWHRRAERQAARTGRIAGGQGPGTWRLSPST